MLSVYESLNAAVTKIIWGVNSDRSYILGILIDSASVVQDFGNCVYLYYNYTAASNSSFFLPSGSFIMHDIQHIC